MPLLTSVYIAMFLAAVDLMFPPKDPDKSYTTSKLEVVDELFSTILS